MNVQEIFIIKVDYWEVFFHFLPPERCIQIVSLKRKWANFALSQQHHHSDTGRLQPLLSQVQLVVVRLGFFMYIFLLFIHFFSPFLFFIEVHDKISHTYFPFQRAVMRAGVALLLYCPARPSQRQGAISNLPQGYNLPLLHCPPPPTPPPPQVILHPLSSLT